MNFWFTLCHTPPVFLLRSHTEIQDSRRRHPPYLSVRSVTGLLPLTLPSRPRLQSSDRTAPLLPELSMFGISAVLGATVSGAYGVALGSRLHSIFQRSSPRLRGISSQGLGLHERPFNMARACRTLRFYRLTPAYLTGSCPRY